MKIVIKVDCNEGEENMWISDIDESQVRTMYQLITEIHRWNGYFPTGSKWQPGQPSIEDLYGNFPGIADFITRLPSPPSGIERISEIYVLSQEVISLFM